MMDRRTFTRIERAFVVTTTLDESDNSDTNNISQSFDQGSGSKLSTKLSTKEKIHQMQAMLKQLEHDVQTDPDENCDDDSVRHNWDDSDDSDKATRGTSNINENKKPVEIKPTGKPQPLPCPTSGEPSQGEGKDEVKTAILITSAQAKLATELIKLANTYKVPELTFSDQAGKRRFG